MVGLQCPPAGGAGARVCSRLWGLYLISSNSSAVQNAILFSGLTAFVLFFGAYGFIAPWGGDIHVYIAAVHSFYRDMWNPSDVSLGVKSGNTVFFAPYLLL